MSEPTPSIGTDVVYRAARAAARGLAGEYGPRLEVDVEAELRTRDDGVPTARQYVDPISLAALIVSAATLAWTVYVDTKKQTPSPTREIVTRRVRLALPAADGVARVDHDRVIDLVVEDILRQPTT